MTHLLNQIQSNPQTNTIEHSGFQGAFNIHMVEFSISLEQEPKSFLSQSSGCLPSCFLSAFMFALYSAASRLVSPLCCFQAQTLCLLFFVGEPVSSQVAAWLRPTFSELCCHKLPFQGGFLTSCKEPLPHLLMLGRILFYFGLIQFSFSCVRLAP